jgi:hypothetical protein
MRNIAYLLALLMIASSCLVGCGASAEPEATPPTASSGTSDNKGTVGPSPGDAAGVPSQGAPMTKKPGR